MQKQPTVLEVRIAVTLGQGDDFDQKEYMGASGMLEMLRLCIRLLNELIY